MYLSYNFISSDYFHPLNVSNNLIILFYSSLLQSNTLAKLNKLLLYFFFFSPSFLLLFSSRLLFRVSMESHVICINRMLLFFFSLLTCVSSIVGCTQTHSLYVMGKQLNQLRQQLVVLVEAVAVDKSNDID